MYEDEKEFFDSMARAFQHALKKLSAKGASAIHEGMTQEELEGLREEFKKSSGLIKGVLDLLKIGVGAE